MVKIVEAPKNVPASEKAAALYTGVQERNNEIAKQARKDKEKEQMMGLFMDLGGVFYQDITDTALANKTQQFFSQQPYIDNKAKATRIMANAAEQIRLQDEAMKYKGGPEAYWREHAIQNEYLPMVTKMLGPRASAAEALTIATGHVDEDLPEYLKNRNEIVDMSRKLTELAGEDTNTLGTYNNRWNQLIGAGRKQEARRLTEAFNLITGRGGVPDADELLKTDTVLRQFNDRFDEYDKEFDSLVGSGFRGIQAKEIKDHLVEHYGPVDPVTKTIRNFPEKPDEHELGEREHPFLKDVKVPVVVVTDSVTGEIKGTMALEHLDENGKPLDNSIGQVTNPISSTMVREELRDAEQARFISTANSVDKKVLEDLIEEQTDGLTDAAKTEAIKSMNKDFFGRVFLYRNNARNTYNLTDEDAIQVADRMLTMGLSAGRTRPAADATDVSWWQDKIGNKNVNSILRLRSGIDIAGGDYANPLLFKASIESLNMSLSRPQAEALDRKLVSYVSKFNKMAPMQQSRYLDFMRQNPNAFMVKENGVSVYDIFLQNSSHHSKKEQQ
tara:strand:- start:115 stop:1785 length:1671 start_codon:yes stop_codon:yes gene_type:complete